MRICVCGAQSVYMSGGAELHQQNLVDALRAAGHETELVRLPVTWAHDKVLQSAFAWRLLSLHADMVVATNSPSYFVRHPCKVVWLFHQHRAAYDALDMAWSDFGLDDRSLATQRQLVEWDNRVLSEAQRVFATSARVAERLSRFNGLDAEVLYHPPPLSSVLHHADPGDYVFCATRLEANKRPDLMISAMAGVRSGVRLLIAGRGSMREQLEEQVRRLGLESRVSLLGFVDDAAAVELFAGAMAVMYVPFDEDYGYVPLQAFYAHKPVITTSDSGGCLEWVRHDETGLVAAADPAALASAVDHLARDPELAGRLGRAGAATVAHLRWSAVVETLLAG